MGGVANSCCEGVIEGKVEFNDTTGIEAFDSFFRHMKEPVGTMYGACEPV